MRWAEEGKKDVVGRGKRSGDVVWYVLFACFFPIAMVGACVGPSALVHLCTENVFYLLSRFFSLLYFCLSGVCACARALCVTKSWSVGGR